MTNKRTAIITGGAGGLGAAFAERLADDGYRIGIVDIKMADDVVNSITKKGGEAKSYVCDITDQSQVDDLVKMVESDLGGCDVLVNNAGRYEFTPNETVDFTLWRKIMSLNVDGMFLVTQGFLSGMKKKGWGRIICIASNSCFNVPPGLTAYVGSKSAVIGYVRSLAGEVGKDGVTVNAVAPGPIITEQLKRSFYQDNDTQDPNAFDELMQGFAQAQAVPRLGKPEDVAPMVSFFASEESAYITGQTMVVDGGMARH